MDVASSSEMTEYGLKMADQLRGSWLEIGLLHAKRSSELLRVGRGSKTSGYEQRMACCT
jgi:hypothetical protein